VFIFFFLFAGLYRTALIGLMGRFSSLLIDLVEEEGIQMELNPWFPFVQHWQDPKSLQRPNPG
jgi:hypothetical protein